MIHVGVDVHHDFCEVAIAEGELVRAAGRVATDPEALARWAAELPAGALVAMEMTPAAPAIAAIIRPHVGEVVLANPVAVRAAAAGAAKTDRADAALLARLLASGFLARVWAPDDTTRARRALVARRMQLVRQRTRAKNQVHAVLARNLVGRAPVSDAFGRAGRSWLAELQLAPAERLIVDGCLRQIDLLESEIGLLDRQIAEQVLGCPEMRRLLTIPGVNALTACALVGAIGEIGRFPSSRAPCRVHRPRSARVAIGRRPGPPRADLKAGPRLRAPRPGRGRLAPRPLGRAATRLPPADRRPPRRQRRDRRGGPQAGGDLLADADQRRRLRLRPAGADGPEASAHRAHRRRPTPARPPCRASLQPPRPARARAPAGGPG